MRVCVCFVPGVEPKIDRLRDAAEALNQGDPGPFAALMAKDSEWRGVSHGHLWLKRRPVCRAPTRLFEC